MGLDRRTFLQRTGLGLLTLGVSQIGLSSLRIKGYLGAKINRHHQALAASTPRKLALLIGINNYLSSDNLKGCITDVELQRELLIYRFGFQPQDVLTLTEKQATREAIETAFVEHLIAQAKGNDVVVFHFSGYGNQVKIPLLNPVDNSSSFSLINSFIPQDGILVNKKTLAMNDLLEETLFLLARSLSSDKVTLVLDTSHISAKKPLQGNFRSRSFSKVSEHPHLEELDFQTELKQNLNISDRSNHTNIKIPENSLILRAAQNEQIATEIVGHNWSAGLFTYALTQYLWEVTPASKIVIAISRTSEQVELIANQIPTLISPGNSNRLMYYLMPQNLIGAEGTITEVNDNTIQAQLTGIPSNIVDYYGLNSIFDLVPNLSQENSSQTHPITPQLRLVDKQGLTAIFSLVENSITAITDVKIGQLIQEQIRVLPRNIGLIVALASSLERIERVDATSALDNLVIVSSIINGGEDMADCVLGKIEADAQTVGYGLLTVGGRIIPKSVGLANEAVKLAVQRLNSSLKTLLVAKLWRLTLNQGSSRLGISASLERIDKTPQTLQRRDTRLVASLTCGGEKAANYQAKLSTCPQGLSPAILSESKGTVSELTKLITGSNIQYRLENYGDCPIYCLLLALDSDGNALAVYEHTVANNTSQTVPEKLLQKVINPQDISIFPENPDQFPWKVLGRTGFVEMFIFCSIAPFENALNVSQNTSFKSEGKQMRILSDPLEITQAILKDLEMASAIKAQPVSSSADSYLLDVNAWATLSFIYQVV